MQSTLPPTITDKRRLLTKEVEMVRFRWIMAWALLVGGIIGWICSPPFLSLWLTTEPPGVLSLSWLAIVLTAWDVMSTTDVRRQQDGE
jgi:hypothetical protein